MSCGVGIGSSELGVGSWELIFGICELGVGSYIDGVQQVFCLYCMLKPCVRVMWMVVWTPSVKGREVVVIGRLLGLTNGKYRNSSLHTRDKNR